MRERQADSMWTPERERGGVAGDNRKSRHPHSGIFGGTGNDSFYGVGCDMSKLKAEEER